ncbi:MAG: EAL domain-containing protein [Lachnospiraceae bacterium]|nr:EAL domain-containing protein [Lachnospiraceae bacterium]
MSDNSKQRSDFLRVALLLGQPEEYCQDLFIRGFSESMLSYGMDVCVFAMYQKYQSTPATEIGDSQIFSLINYKDFDCICIMGDSIQTPGKFDQLTDDIRQNFTGPVLVVEKETPGFINVLQDNYNPPKKIINHLIEKHGYKDIAFLTGKSWHPHSKLRLKAFMDAMADHGLEVGPDRVFYGDFWYTSGEKTAERLLREDKLPEAIACANDCMALGFAKTIIENGLRIPEDIAIVGYDCSDEGMHAPIPITSCPIPIRELGMYCADKLYNTLHGIETKDFIANPDLFIGESCGCEGDSCKPTFITRDTWSTVISGGSLYSVFNRMTDDMIDQTNFRGLLSTIYSYVYQLENFDFFHLILNDGWLSERVGYSSRFLNAVTVRQNDGFISTENYCDRADYLDSMGFRTDPSKPASLSYFLPVYHNNKTLGFTVLGFTDRVMSLTQTARMWVHGVSNGLEIFRKTNELQNTKRIMNAGFLSDPLTGLPNYNAFLSEKSGLLERIITGGGDFSACAFDIKNLTKVNSEFGRNAGDSLIVGVAAMLESIFKAPAGHVYYTGSGEFAAIAFTNEAGMNDLLRKVDDALAGFNADPSAFIVTELYRGNASGNPKDDTELERVLNVALSKKNGSKFDTRLSSSNSGALTPDEIKQAKEVEDVLNKNRFNYHFQPIIKASDGDIYAYEALMRPDTDPYIIPPVIIKYADYLGRLYDVERATFLNVLKRISSTDDPLKKGRKIFINSIPGIRLKGRDIIEIEKKMLEYAGSIVVELTEQTEISDEELSEVKSNLIKLGASSAVDDYGTGFSNVVNLLRYMPDYVKIDRSLISDIQNSPQKQHFVKDIISFSHDNGIMALAEGVETHDELKMVIKLGVDLIQGFYTAKPQALMLEDTAPEIRKEILDIRDQIENGDDSSVYIAGREGRIIMSKLADDGVRRILVNQKEMTFVDFTLVGTPGVVTNLTLEISNGYKGCITLENCSFGFGSNTRTPITIGPDCVVTLQLNGTNKINGRLLADDNSTIGIDGDGELDIVTDDELSIPLDACVKSETASLRFNYSGKVIFSKTGSL